MLHPHVRDLFGTHPSLEIDLIDVKQLTANAFAVVTYKDHQRYEDVATCDLPHVVDTMLKRFTGVHVLVELGKFASAGGMIHLSVTGAKIV